MNATGQKNERIRDDDKVMLGWGWRDNGNKEWEE